MGNIFGRMAHTCVIHISGGDPERFLNLCKHGNLPLSNLVYDETGIFATIAYKNFDKIKSYEEKSHCRCSVVVEKGLIPTLKKYKKHMAFGIGLLLFAGLVFYSSLFIWHIDVEGTSDYTNEEIISYVTETLVPLGTKRQAVCASELEKQLRMQYDRLAWVTCEVDGTRLVIRLVETIEEEKITKPEQPCNVVAVKDALITESIATSGTKLAEPGDEVKKGDVLITGVVHVYNEYEELIETNYVPADGSVYGQTVYNYEKEIPLQYTKRVQGKRKKRSVFICIGEQKKKLYMPRKTEGYEKVEHTYTLHIGHSYYLPVSLVIGDYYRPEYSTETYTEEEAAGRQKVILQSYVEALQKKGVEIIENNVKIVCRDGKCLASGTIVARELIGAPEAITMPEQTDTENKEE